jgi:hypothetical protein
MKYLRKDGTQGEMSCRFHVKKYLKNTDSDKKRKPQKDYLVTVFNLQKMQYRSIIIENIISLKVRGVVIDLKDLKMIAEMKELLAMAEVMANGCEVLEYEAVPENCQTPDDYYQVA